MRGAGPSTSSGAVVHLAGVQDAVAASADVDERGLHAGQHVLDAAQVDVPDHRRRALARDVVLHEHILFEDGDLVAVAVLGDHHELVGDARRRRLRLAAAATVPPAVRERVAPDPPRRTAGGDLLLDLLLRLARGAAASAWRWLRRRSRRLPFLLEPSFFGLGFGLGPRSRSRLRFAASLVAPPVDEPLRRRRFRLRAVEAGARRGRRRPSPLQLSGGLGRRPPSRPPEASGVASSRWVATDSAATPSVSVPEPVGVVSGVSACPVTRSRPAHRPPSDGVAVARMRSCRTRRVLRRSAPPRSVGLRDDVRRLPRPDGDPARVDPSAWGACCRR